MIHHRDLEPVDIAVASGMLATVFGALWSRKPTWMRKV